MIESLAENQTRDPCERGAARLEYPAACLCLAELTHARFAEISVPISTILD